MNYSDDNLTHIGLPPTLTNPQQLQWSNNSSFSSNTNSSSEHNETDNAFANIFSTNLEDLFGSLELSDDDTCEETEEMVSEAMSLPEAKRERRLEEIQQHVRFMKAQEKRKKILNDKNHRPFDDSNIGLCSVCLDDNFQIIHPYGTDTACDNCLREMMQQNAK